MRENIEAIPSTGTGIQRDWHDTVVAVFRAGFLAAGLAFAIVCVGAPRPGPAAVLAAGSGPDSNRLVPLSARRLDA